MTTPRFQLADELLRRFAAALRSAQLYSKGHPIIGRNLEALSAAIQLLHTLEPTIVIGMVGDEVIVDDVPVAKADTLGGSCGGCSRAASSASRSTAASRSTK